MKVQLDYVANASIRRDQHGTSVIRKGRVSAVGGSPEARAIAALNAPGLPRYGDAYAPAPNLKCVDIQLTAIDTNQWDVTIVYRRPRPEDEAHMGSPGRVIDIHWFSSNITAERSLDAEGRRMLHIYSGWPVVPVVSAGQLRLRRSSGRLTAWKAETAEVQLPAVGVRIMMAEATDPSSRLSFVSKVNAGFWSGYSPKTWLFVGPVSGTKERGRWINTYELVYRPDTWRLESLVEVQGAPPSNATEGNGLAYFDVFKEANFGTLGFTL